MHQRAYVKGGFNWTLLPSKGQAAKGHTTSHWCDRFSNPFFALIITLSAFLAISAGVLSLSEYWALQTPPGGSYGRLPCGTIGELTQGKGDGLPKGWDSLKDRTFFLIIDVLALTEPSQLLAELASALARTGAKVNWLTTQTEPAAADGQKSLQSRLEAKLEEQKVKVLKPDVEETLVALLTSDLMILGSIPAATWLDSMDKDQLTGVLKKTIWWIREQASQFAEKTLPSYLPRVAAIMVDHQATAEEWRDAVTHVMSIEIAETYVVPLGISRDASLAADTPVARSVLRRFVRESLDLPEDAVVVAALGGCPGQDQFLRAFRMALDSCKAQKSELAGAIYALLVTPNGVSLEKQGADLRQFVRANGLLPAVRSGNWTQDDLPYLAASDVAVVHCQEKSLASERTLLNAMAFRLPLLVSANGASLEVVTNRSTALVHASSKEGTAQLASNLAEVILDPAASQRLTKAAYASVAGKFLETHFLERFDKVLRAVLEGRSQGGASLRSKWKKRVKLVVEVVR